MQINYLKNTSNEVHFFDKVVGWGSGTLPKIFSLESAFQDFCSDLLLSLKMLRYLKKVYFLEKRFGCGS